MEEEEERPAKRPRLNLDGVRSQFLPWDLPVELWETIRSFLGTPFTSHDLVAFQRTCKGFYAMKEGLLLPPMWEAVWNLRALHHVRRQIMLTAALRIINDEGLWKLPVPIDIQLSSSSFRLEWKMIDYPLILYYNQNEDNTWVIYCRVYPESHTFRDTVTILSRLLEYFQ